MEDLIARCRAGIGMTQRNVPKVMNGSKTQTRRIISVEWSGKGRNRAFQIRKGGEWVNSDERGFAERVLQLSPYKVGDLLYVKEALASRHFASDGNMATYKVDGDWVRGSMNMVRRWESDSGKTWKPNVIPARYMPKTAARTFVKITDKKVERIQDISEQDCIAEGCTFQGTMAGSDSTETSHRGAFVDLWNDTNGDFAWDVNDWCFAYTFELVTKG